MIYLFMLCTAELAQVDVQVEMKHVPKEHREIPPDVLWVEQCVAKKEAGL